MFRRRLVCRIASSILDEGSHVEINQYESVNTITEFEHDVVDADVAMDDVRQIAQVADAWKTKKCE